MTSRHLPRPAISLVALVVVVALALLGPVLTAHAAARVAVAGQPHPDRATTVRVSGSGFQSVPKAFGGVYVFFGWVSDPSGGSWAPSRGGVSGDSYRYVPDAETAQNAGYQRFVAFPGSSTEAEANGGTIAADGSWSTDLVIPGARFEAADGGTVDCTAVRCGIITIGAHGVRNANNETFTPVTFAGADGGSGADAGAGSDDGADGGAGGGNHADAGAGEGEAAAGNGSGAGSSGGGPDGAAGGRTGTGNGADDGSGDTASDRRPGTATLGIDQATAVVGRVMSFGAQGLEPGEQVTVTLDDGVVAVGPLVAGNHGEVAGLVELPSDLRTGTHVLRLTGASSGTEVETEVTVTRDPAEVTAAEEASEAAADAAGTGSGTWRPEEIAVGGAALLLLVVVLSSLVTSLRRRAERRRAEREGDGGDRTAAEQQPTEPDGAEPDEAGQDDAGQDEAGQRQDSARQGQDSTGHDADGSTAAAPVPAGDDRDSRSSEVPA